MRTGTCTAIIERCLATGQYVGHVPGLPGTHTHADSLDELHLKLADVVTLVLEEEDTQPETEFIGTLTVRVSPTVEPPARIGLPDTERKRT